MKVLRKKDKVEKYIDLLLKKYNFGNCCVVESGKSRYYNINGRILRISDHVGQASSGNMSIIIPQFTNGYYVIHAHSEGSISVLSYEQVKKVVESFIMCCQFMQEITQKNIDLQIDKRERSAAVVNDADHILGVPVESFTAGQVKQIRLYIKQNGK